MIENAFSAITDYTVNERMIEILLEDREYQEVLDQITSRIKLFEALHLEKERWMVIECLLSLHAKTLPCMAG